MINFITSNVDISKARKEHLDFFSCYVTKRLTGSNCTKECGRYLVNMPNRSENSKSTNFNELVNFVLLDDNLTKILDGSPSELLIKHTEIVNLINRLYGANSYENYLQTQLSSRPALGDIDDFFKDIYAVFNYTWLNGLQPTDDYSAYKLSENLGIRSCTYCNRTYTVTRTTSAKGKLMRPELDHWYPKSKYPLLAISFYNLIPCCSYCNSSVKGDVDLNLTEHIHPYVEEMNDEFSFGYFFSKKVNSYKIFIKKPYHASGKTLNTLKKLKVDEMYNAHHPELEDLIKIKQAYSTSYLKNMAAFFPKTGLTEEETYKLLFGTECDEMNFHKRPFSKFKRDILIELGIIKK